MTSSNRSPKVFQRAEQGNLIISISVLDSIVSYHQDSPSATEAGGVLLGRYSASSADIVIESATFPQKRDRRSRHRFYRAKQPHQEIIDAAWRESGGTVTYLGEWHTHPEDVPIPSVIDSVGWTKKLMFDQFSDAIFFVILGTQTMRVWEGSRRTPSHHLIGEDLI